MQKVIEKYPKDERTQKIDAVYSIVADHASDEQLDWIDYFMAKPPTANSFRCLECKNLTHSCNRLCYYSRIQRKGEYFLQQQKAIKLIYTADVPEQLVGEEHETPLIVAIKSEERDLIHQIIQETLDDLRKRYDREKNKQHPIKNCAFRRVPERENIPYRESTC